MLAFTYGLARADLFCSESCDNDGLTAVAIVGGLAAFGIGTLDDVISAPLQARKKNDRNRAAAMQLSIAPRITQQDAGVVIGGRF